jgi:hypothetical protein
LSWENCRLKVHGYAVRREKNGRLTPECRQQLRTISLRFHDLRREAGARFLEGGMSPNYVQKFLDHAKLSDQPVSKRHLIGHARRAQALRGNARSAGRQQTGADGIVYSSSSSSSSSDDVGALIASALTLPD